MYEGVSPFSLLFQIFYDNIYDMKKIRFFYNDNSRSKKVLGELRKSLIETKKFSETHEGDADYCVAIGGDGAFLRMVNVMNFNSKPKYAGINTGTLGFLQTVKPEELKQFEEELLSENFEESKLSYLECVIKKKEGEEKFCCLNEVVFREREYNVVHLNVKVSGAKLESFSGDGMLICSSVGSTAYNLSYGGSIVPHSFNTMQITPMAPLSNAVYRSLTSSVVLLENEVIEIEPEQFRNDLLIHRDGEHMPVDDIEKITIRLAEKRLTHLSFGGHSIYEKINEKFLR